MQETKNWKKILPGVNVDDNSVIGAGNEISRDIPSNCIAFGTPCKVIWKIGEKDQKYYYFMKIKH